VTTGGWTPGQRAILRAAVGLSLTIALLMADPSAPLALAGAVLGLVYALGLLEMGTTAALAVVLAVIGLQPADPFTIALGLALLVHALRWPLEACWMLLAASLAWSCFIHWQPGGGKLASAEVIFVLLILTRSARPWIWLALLAAQIALIAVGRGMLINAAPILLLLCAFDPAWIPARAMTLPLTVFYDGACGFCHASVRFLLQEDRTGLTLRFAPLQGQSFAAAVPEAQRVGLPDSIVVREPGGLLRVRSDGALLIGAALGGLWRPLAALARLIPPPLRDAVYDGIARVRGHLFRKPEGLCPLLPKEWMSRFDSD
jgi:predicted DCC family thiol-disulfide oxidoreductase YuxK